MPSRSQYNRRGSDGDEDEIVAVSSDSEESESEANRGAEADDDDDDEYVGESSDAGGGDEAEEAGRSDCGEGGDVDGDDHDGHGKRPLRGLRRGAAAPDKERKSQNVDALVRYALTPPADCRLRDCAMSHILSNTGCTYNKLVGSLALSNMRVFNALSNSWEKNVEAYRPLLAGNGQCRAIQPGGE